MQADFIKPEDETWSSLLAQVDHDVYHLPGYIRTAAIHEGGEPVALVVEDREARLFLPLVLRPVAVAGDAQEVGGLRDAISPYGYPHPLLIPETRWDDRAFLEAAIHQLVSVLGRQGIVSAFIRLHPLMPFPGDLASLVGPVVTHGETVAIDLVRTPEEMLSQMRKNHLRWIKRALRDGHRFVVSDSPEDLDEFVDIYLENMAYVGATDYYRFDRAYFESLLNGLRGSIQLAFVEIGGQKVCGMMLSEVCGYVQYHLGGTRSEFRHISPMVFLTHQLALWARERGNRFFHLGGGVGGQVDSLFQFKAGFSDLRYPFRTWRIVTDGDAYGELTRRWEERNHRPADGLTGFFPAYRNVVDGEAALSDREQI